MGDEQPVSTDWLMEAHPGQTPCLDEGQFIAVNFSLFPVLLLYCLLGIVALGHSQKTSYMQISGSQRVIPKEQNCVPQKQGTNNASLLFGQL